MYANREDMVRAFGERECVSLTDRNYTGQIDDDVLNGALVQASAEIDGYLCGRYPVPGLMSPCSRWSLLQHRPLSSVRL